MNISKQGPLIVLFDGECNLCNGLVQFLIRHDKTGERFRFAAQQSDAGQSRLKTAGFVVDGNTADTLLVFSDGKILTYSDAALEIIRYLPAPYPMLSVGAILPKSLRDGLYRLVARNRYQWFGKREDCMLPTPELKARFLT